MSKQLKKLDSSGQQVISHTHAKIFPHKIHYITFKSDYDYGDCFDVIPCLVKNPKWCYIKLKLGHTGTYIEYQQLRRAKSLRLRSLHLENYQLDSQGCGDRINRYFREIDPLARAGHTLKKLSLSVTLNDGLMKKNNQQDVHQRLEKFVKKQKHLDEFAFYNGEQDNSKKVVNWLAYFEKNLKVLTIENLSVDLFRKYTFPKLEVLRLEYILFQHTELSFDFSLLMRCLEQIFSLHSLKGLKFVKYQRYQSKSYDELLEDWESDEEDKNFNKYKSPSESAENDSESAENDSESAENVQEAEKETKNEDLGISADDEEDESHRTNENEDEENAAKIDEEAENNAQFSEEDKNQSRNENESEDSGDKSDQEPDGTGTLCQEFPVEFWEALRESLDNHKTKLLKVKYHKQSESKIAEKRKEFERIFTGLSLGQSFEYEVRQIKAFSRGFGFESKTRSLTSTMFL